jgi:pimeloyl-ACP methyl ester carboxylesterase
MTRMILLLVAIALLLGVGYWLWTPDKPRAALEAKYLRDPGDMISVAGARLHVRDSGPKDGPAVIMIHGFGSSLHTWDSWANGLQDRFRVIRFDLPGSGLSEPDALGRYDDRRSFEILAALMDQLGVRQAGLIGNSIGGRISWGFAAAQPDRVAKLVLVAPDGFASQGFSYGVAPKVPKTLEAMQYVLPRFMLKMNLAPAYGDPKALTEGMVDRYHDLMLAPGVRAALIERMRQTVLESPEGILSRIKAPVLLVWGEKDGAIPVSNAADYQRLLPRSELVTFPGVGHLPQEEASQTTLPAVKAFLLR